MEMATSSFTASDFKFPFSSKNTRSLSRFSGLKHQHKHKQQHSLFRKCFHFQSQSTRMLASNVYNVGKDTSMRINSKIYTNLDSCLVIPPTPNRSKPRAIIKFLGGAFIGAIPQVTYGYLLECLAKEGFLVVVVPYNVTFDHSLAAKQVYERFHACFDSMLTFGLPQANLSPAQLGDLPLFSVGHSNGALLQLLTGSLFSEKLPKLGPAVSQMMPVVEANPFYSIARNASGDAWKMMLDTVGSVLQENEQEVLNSLTKFVDQLPSVMNEVTQGVSEFRPTPPENRDCFKSSYNVKHTLLVKFNSDTIDETDILEETIKTRVDSLGGTVEKVQLNGNHITPCIQEPRWQVGKLYTPADAIAQVLKSISLSETKILARTISDWFKRFED